MPPQGASGWRAYAICDVHGRLHLLDGLLDQIEEDHASRGGSDKALLVFLGDLIDRGPQSYEVLERVRSEVMPYFKTVVLAGNHEELMRRVLDGDPELLRKWLSFGGAECLASYGINPSELLALPKHAWIPELRSRIPKEHQALIRGLDDSIRFGDYLFVHAGIRPGSPLERQSASDLRWIREPFLADRRDHGVVVVHGHTISIGIDEQINRIGIDTGTY